VVHPRCVYSTIISIKILYKSKTTFIYYYYVECQINDNMFRPFLILTRSNIVAKEEHTKHIICFVCSFLAIMFDLMMAW